MSFEMPPQIVGIIIGIVVIVIGFALINASPSFPQIWSIFWAGVVAIIGGFAIIGLTVKSSI